ncbi:MAG: hypothetical protein NZL83_02905 [Candidatus Absconditabacterales bacterium]|nr:hypothetical protein [Candidatus Absconditabacterales bacterium]
MELPQTTTKQYSAQEIDQIHGAINILIARYQFSHGLNTIVTLSAKDVLSCLKGAYDNAKKSIHTMVAKQKYVATPVDYKPEDVIKSWNVLEQLGVRKIQILKILSLVGNEVSVGNNTLAQIRKLIAETLQKRLPDSFSGEDNEQKGSIAKHILVRLGDNHFDASGRILSLDEKHDLTYESIKNNDNLPSFCGLSYLQAILYKAIYNATLLWNGQTKKNLNILGIPIEEGQSIDDAINTHVAINSLEDFVSKIKTFLVTDNDNRHNQRIKASMINILYMTYAIHGQHNIGAIKHALETMRDTIKKNMTTDPSRCVDFQSQTDQNIKSVKHFFSYTHSQGRITTADRTKETSSVYIKALSQETYATLEMFQDLLGIRFEINFDAIQQHYGLDTNTVIVMVMRHCLETIKTNSVIQSMELADKKLIQPSGSFAGVEGIFEELQKHVFGGAANLFTLRGRGKSDATKQPGFVDPAASYKVPNTITSAEQMILHLAYAASGKGSGRYEDAKIAGKSEVPQETDGSVRQILIGIEAQIIRQKKPDDLVHPNEAHDASHFVLDLGDKGSCLMTRTSGSFSANDMYHDINHTVQKMQNILQNKNESAEKKNKIKAFLERVENQKIDAINDATIMSKKVTAKILNYLIHTNKVWCAYFDNYTGAKLQYEAKDFDNPSNLATHHFVHAEYQKRHLKETGFVDGSRKHVCYHPSLVEKTSEELQQIAVAGYAIKAELLQNDLQKYLMTDR